MSVQMMRADDHSQVYVTPRWIADSVVFLLKPASSFGQFFSNEFEYGIPDMSHGFMAANGTKRAVHHKYLIPAPSTSVSNERINRICWIPIDAFGMAYAYHEHGHTLDPVQREKQVE